MNPIGGGEIKLEIVELTLFMKNALAERVEDDEVMPYTTDITSAGYARVLSPDGKVVEGYHGPLVSKQLGLAEACADYLNERTLFRRGRESNQLASEIAFRYKGVKAKQIVSLCGEVR